MPGKWRYIKAPKRNNLTDVGHWSDQKKHECLTTYLATRSPLITSQQTNVPVSTIESWMRKDWWKQRVQEIQSEDYEKLDVRLTKVIDKTLDALVDRIEDGEYMFDIRTGKIKRIPAKMRDLNTALTTVIDKRQLIRKMPTKITEQTTTATQLQNLADQFKAFVTGIEKKETFDELVKEVIEGETVTKGADGTYTVKE